MNYTVKCGRNFLPNPYYAQFVKYYCTMPYASFYLYFPVWWMNRNISSIFVLILNSRWYYFQFICHSENKMSNHMAEIVGVVCFCYSEFSLYLFPRWCPGATHWIVCKCNTMRSCDNVTAVWNIYCCQLHYFA